MSKPDPRQDSFDIKSRRSLRSRRRMSAGRRAYYALGMPVLRFIFWLVSASYRVQKIIGEEIADRIIADQKTVYAPCYWHQHHVLCSNLMRSWIRRGFRACFLVSASVDGDVPARIARSWGAEVIRGSANQTGALVLRDMQQKIKEGVAIVTTADGPNGPKYEFKPGAVLMARIGGTPLVPLACAADRAWYLNRWDDFMIPKPFARVVLAVGEPVEVPRDASMQRLEDYRLQMQYATNALMQESKLLLEQE
ncbi:MAG: lysophospholipid acyltransferase family protein [Gammaproteobacteria bacterium]|nr:lysophospholipid acyltransferase family protein [Gammaproteobacteria bacterium]MDH5344756.1 lysophospholipid acyltransferase family protein [Gammaproteobacteria bacterium]